MECSCARSQTPFAGRFLKGPVICGVSLGHGHLLFGGAVISLTRPGELRMPNGIECDLPEPEAGLPCAIGRGRLEGDFGVVVPGPLWDPRPNPRFAVRTQRGPDVWRPELLVGRGPGLTPLGDDIIAGWLGARALIGLDPAATVALAESLAGRTTSLSGTLIRLAARGQLPEAAHRLLEDGDVESLLSWGASSGRGLLVGLGLNERVVRTGLVRRFEVSLALDGSFVGPSAAEDETRGWVLDTAETRVYVEIFSTSVRGRTPQADLWHPTR